MKKTIFALLFSLSAIGSFAQNDPTVMVINGQVVPRSEFEYSYRKNNSEGVIDKKSVKEYVDLFINYKLKVQAAYDAKLDTMTSFKNEFAEYRNQLVLPTMITDDDVEKEAQEIYRNTAERIGPDGLIKCSHILLTVESDADAANKAAVKERIDSIHNALVKGADFAELAKQLSQDPGSAKNGGKMDQWVQHGQFVREFDTAAFALQKGELSQPVQTQFGWHIIKMDDRKQFDSYDTLRSDIYRFIEARNLRDQIAKKAVSERATAQGVDLNDLTAKQALELSENNPETKYLIMEYHDGLLLYEMSTREVWGKADKDEKALADFFKKNKKKYAWETPRYKGIAYHTKTKDDLKAVKKAVKKLKFDEWGDKLKQTFNKDSVIRVRAEKGVFNIGDNALVDSLVFKSGKPAKEVKGYPYKDVCGKVLKAPESYTDIKAQVISDYQEYLEKQWVTRLRKKYYVHVYQDEIDKIKE
ncbi:MAG: peptidylprolyl isomerase [Prevotella sp.]|nr:peptidylprolyl isomerase [Prevotella sp.]MCF0207824.1 peptidylprolyl isomerase [Bacteroidaceae bacterium]